MILLNLLAGFAASATAQHFADSVIDYQSGTGFADGYTDASTALGQPSRVTPDPFGGPVDPFNSAYKAEQLVSIGTGGSLTLGFSQPIQNNPMNAFGVDFIVFGNSGFTITNDFDPETFEFIGEPATDGSLFSADTTSTAVYVSQDNTTYYQLDITLAPVFERYAPTDGAGDFARTVDPSLGMADFAGLTLEGIRTLYDGSAGGTGYDISWARDSMGNPVSLESVSYVRLEVLSGKAEIDGIAAVPEPKSIVLAVLGCGCLFLRRRFKNGRLNQNNFPMTP